MCLDKSFLLFLLSKLTFKTSYFVLSWKSQRLALSFQQLLIELFNNLVEDSALWCQWLVAYLLQCRPARAAVRVPSKCFQTCAIQKKNPFASNRPFLICVRWYSALILLTLFCICSAHPKLKSNQNQQNFYKAKLHLKKIVLEGKNGIFWEKFWDLLRFSQIWREILNLFYFPPP